MKSSYVINSYGNLFQRVISMIFKNCNEVIPLKPSEFKNEDIVLLNSIKDSLDEYKTFIDKQKFDQFLKNIWLLISEANKYVDEQAPWSLKKKNFIRMEVVLYTLIEVLRQVSILLQAFIPNSSKYVLDCIRVPSEERNIKSINSIFKGGVKISLPKPLFPRI